MLYQKKALSKHINPEVQVHILPENLKFLLMFLTGKVFRMKQQMHVHKKWNKSTNTQVRHE